MNSLNLLSSGVFGQSSYGVRPRSKSQGELLNKEPSDERLRGRSYSAEKVALLRKDLEPAEDDTGAYLDSDAFGEAEKQEDDEKQPLLEVLAKDETSPSVGSWRRLIKRVADALTAILAAIGAPVIYIARCFQNSDGSYNLFSRRARSHGSGAGLTTAKGLSSAASDGTYMSEKPASRVLQQTKLRHSYSSDSLTSGTSDSDTDVRKTKQTRSGTRPKREIASDAAPETRRSSIRIKEQNDPALKKRKQKRSGSPLNDVTSLTVDNIKSPTSPSPSLKVTRYPHAPQPPRPIVPRRQPSYSSLVPRLPTRGFNSSPQQKTLVLDLDETLIHSLAKGGRMSSGHMVEVKLNAPVAVSTPQQHQPAQVIGPQHPILYYVHKRPHCDEFLKKVCKWYKLVVFTASVQEYADPVIDWLEQERKYFVGRYYRQHCTFRNGAYIKDLSSIEPDLSKVIILDNSPVSYIFHEDNAIPIEGWINDPTDNDLVHLIPMLEALQYVTDVRALLALRRGEAGPN